MGMAFSAPRSGLISAADVIRSRPPGYYAPQPSIRVHRPNLPERVTNVASDALAKLGMKRREANRLGRKLSSFLGDLTPAGGVYTAAEAREAFKAGKAAQGASLAGLAIVGSVPGIGGAAAKGVKKGLSAAKPIRGLFGNRPQYSGLISRPTSNGKIDLGASSTGFVQTRELPPRRHIMPENFATSKGASRDGKTDPDIGKAPPDLGEPHSSAGAGNKIGSDTAMAKSFEGAPDTDVVDTSDARDRDYAFHSWESAPGSNTGHMQGFDHLPWKDKARYHDEARGAFLTPVGRSRIGQGYGGVTGTSFDNVGLYEGVVNPGTQDRIAVARATGAQGLSEGSKALMDAIANTQGLLGAQKAAAWNYQSPATSTWKDATSVRFDLGRRMTVQDIERYRPMIKQAYPSGNVDMLPDLSGFKISQFGLEDRTPNLGAFVQELRNGHPELQNATPTKHSGNYIENAWDAPEGRYGAQFVSNLEKLNLPDVGKKFDSFAPDIADKMLTVDARTAAEYGLKGAEDIELLRHTIADKGWDGLMNLIKNGNVSSAVVPLFLSWMGFQASQGDGS